MRGNPNAGFFTLVEYGDFECPFCSRATGSASTRSAPTSGDELRYVWRHLPLERVQPARSVDAARASEAAALQGRFFEMATRMFEFQDYLEWEAHLPLRRRRRRSTSREFDEDLRSAQGLAPGADDARIAELMDLNSTPTFFVNGRRHQGPWDAADSDSRTGGEPGLAVKPV